LQEETTQDESFMPSTDGFISESVKLSQRTLQKVTSPDEISCHLQTASSVKALNQAHLLTYTCMAKHLLADLPKQYPSPEGA